HQEDARAAQLADQFAEPCQGARTKHDAGERLVIERRQRPRGAHEVGDSRDRSSGLHAPVLLLWSGPPSSSSSSCHTTIRLTRQAPARMVGFACLAESLRIHRAARQLPPYALVSLWKARARNKKSTMFPSWG